MTVNRLSVFPGRPAMEIQVGLKATSFCCNSIRSEYSRNDHRNAHRLSMSQDAQVLSLPHDS
jgi:hypothetical protein